MMDNIADAPFAPWLESVIKELFDIMPKSVAMEMMDEDGKIYTCYWEVSANDRALMIDAMKDDERIEWLKCNRDLILDILNEDEDEEEGEDESTMTD